MSFNVANGPGTEVSIVEERDMIGSHCSGPGKREVMMAWTKMDE